MTPQQDHNGANNIPLGILWMLGTVCCFVSLDATMKVLTQTYPVPQVAWARFVFHVVILLFVFNRRVFHIIRTNRLKHQMVRSGLMLTVTVLTIVSLKYIPLASLSALMMMGPIFVTALSVPLLGERVGVHRWAGVIAGFTGALVIIRPGSSVMDPVSLIVLFTALCYALFQISTRVLNRTESMDTTLLYSGLIGMGVMSVWAPFEWVTPDLAGWVKLIALGGFGSAGHFCMIRALSMAPAAVIAPFGYTNIIGATLLGYLLFGNIPDAMTVLGAAIIFASGLYIFYREARARKAADRQRPEELKGPAP